MHDLGLARYIGAPPEEVFEAWLDGDGLGRWLFRTPGGVLKTSEADAREGGGFTITETRGAIDATHFGTFRTIERPHRIVFAFAVARDQAPSEVRVEIAASGHGTLLVLTHAVDPKWAEYATMILAGWSRMLGSLSAHLSLRRTRSLSLSGIVEAKPTEVWRAWTEPERIAGWWGGAEATRPVIEHMDVRPGGGFRLRIAPPHGPVFTIKGTYREVVAGKRLVYDDVCEADGKPFYEEVLDVAFSGFGKGRTLLRVEAPLAPDMLKQPETALDDVKIGWARGWADNLDALMAQFDHS